MSLDKIIQSLLIRFDEVKDSLSKEGLDYSSPEYLKIQREYKYLEKAVDVYHSYQKTLKELEDSRLLIQGETNKELVDLALEEIEILEKRQETLESNLMLSLIPPDPDEGKNIFIEITMGAGGDEAGIFVGDLYRMYSMFCNVIGLSFSLETIQNNEGGGYKEVVIQIKGENAYSYLKFEGGVHRVQRVPKTESQGRVHTSTARVVVMPESKEEDFELKPDEIKIETTRAQGAGGQHVNKTESAVKIYHLPTGITAQCQDERSQFKNKAKAMNILRAKVKQVLDSQKRDEEDVRRKLQAGSGERAEKIRTYNYPQNRITDHRIKKTLYSLMQFMDGEIFPLIELLMEDEKKQLVDHFVSKNA